MISSKVYFKNTFYVIWYSWESSLGPIGPIVGLRELAKTTKQTFQMVASSYYSIIHDNYIIEILWEPFPINTLKLRQNHQNFRDNSKNIFLTENFSILIKIQLKFFPEGPINCKPAMVPIKAWHQAEDKPLYKPMLA